MPRSRRFRKSQNQVKPAWGKNNPQTKAKNRKTTIILGVIAVAVVVLAAFFVLVPNGLFGPSPSATPTPTPSASPTPQPTPQPTATLSPGVQPLASPSGEYSSDGAIVLFETSMGNITIQLRDDRPLSRQNFIDLVTQGKFDGTIFHRVIKDFMIQGGNIGQSWPTVYDEIGLDNTNSNGTIAMANTGAANSATSQFFINVADNSPRLDATFDSKYTVFGKVIGGMDVVMAISHVPLQYNELGELSQPTQEITLIRALLVTH